MTTHRPPRCLVSAQAALARALLKVGNLLLSLVAFCLFRRSSVANPANILVLRSSGIGDFIYCLPALAFLGRGFPKASICLLTTATANPETSKSSTTPGALMTENGTVVDEIVLFDGVDIRRPAKALELRRRLRGSRFDLAYIIPQTGASFTGRLKKLLFLRCLGVRGAVRGYKTEQSLSFFRRAQFLQKPFDHQVVTAMKAVGATNDEPIEFPISIPPSAVSRVDELWRENGLQEAGPVVGLFPGGKFEHRRWPLEKFSLLCQSLLTESDARIVIVGGAAERPLAGNLCALDHRRLIDLTGRCSLLETAEVLRRCSLYVGNDSGPAHIAAAVGTQCVTIWPSLLFPGIGEQWGEGNIAIRHRVPCEYCFSETFCPRGTSECIVEISVEEVLKAVRTQIQRRLRETKSAVTPQ